MSNVRIEAIEDVGLEINITLGPHDRGIHIVPPGESVELAVGGNQKLTVAALRNVHPSVEEDVAIGVDVDPEPESPPDPAADDTCVLEDSEGNTLEPGVDVFDTRDNLAPAIAENIADAELDSALPHIENPFDDNKVSN